MKKETINLSTIEVAKVWQPTMMLRWNESNIYCSMRDEFKKTLQQMWTSNLGDIEWKDIPIENENIAISANVPPLLVSCELRNFLFSVKDKNYCET